MPRTRKFSELSDRVTSDPKRRARVERERRRIVGEILSHQLDELRRARHVTQRELAERLGIQQPNVSRLEHGEDPKLSTLRAYVEALGGRLELTAAFDDEDPIPLSL